MASLKKKFDYSWVIICVCFLLSFVCLGFCSSNKSLYLSAITEALHVPRSLFSLNDTIRYITTTGKVESGSVVCISVQPERAQRKIKFVQSGEIRIVNDHLIIEVDGTKFLTH